MGQDISVNSLDLLKSYNGHIKTFNNSVNMLIMGLRRKVESIISDKKTALKRLENHFQVAEGKIDNRLEKLNSLLNGYNWDAESELRISMAINDVENLKSKLNMMMHTIREDHSKLSLQLDQLIQTSVQFSQSNQQLLDSNILRMEKSIQALDNYKSNVVK